MKRQRDWHVEDIKAEIRKRYGSLSALSTTWGLNSQAVSNVLSNPMNSRRVGRMIAAALDTTPHELWPEYWTPDGSPISHRPDRSPTGTEADALRAKRSVA